MILPIKIRINGSMMTDGTSQRCFSYRAMRVPLLSDRFIHSFMVQYIIAYSSLWLRLIVGLLLVSSIHSVASLQLIVTIKNYNVFLWCKDIVTFRTNIANGRRKTLNVFLLGTNSKSVAHRPCIMAELRHI